MSHNYLSIFFNNNIKKQKVNYQRTKDSLASWAESLIRFISSSYANGRGFVVAFPF